MSYTLDDVNLAVAGFAEGRAAAPAWDSFYQYLLNNEAVKLHLGQAIIQQNDGSVALDSYGDYESGDVSFVFSIDAAPFYGSDARRFFKRDGYNNSYDTENRFSGPTTEVEPAKQATITTNWKAI